ncbi:hypothetical protein SK854_45830 [Lentzea sp. BCCO 10_0061]|uniref:Uncharacterized protein n=1 Tax=Lentzea sokolovensis TaxID=3095429 RepID=A0ABU4VCI3_9PSEU|nr:hypothetical protein [Lentzea sp. BCCO 10_0061]MDX8149511.1 hypothetical protein [Lentzea sp. BCCO 10_0061]
MNNTPSTPAARVFSRSNVSTLIFGFDFAAPSAAATDTEVSATRADLFAANAPRSISATEAFGHIGATPAKFLPVRASSDWRAPAFSPATTGSFAGTGGL